MSVLKSESPSPALQRTLNQVGNNSVASAINAFACGAGVHQKIKPVEYYQVRR
jgi:hypothetical protein